MTDRDDELIYDTYLILVDSDVDNAMQEKILDALHELEPGIGWEIRTVRPGEAVGTYGKQDGRLPQILGYTISVPERIDRAINSAWNRSL